MSEKKQAGLSEGAIAEVQSAEIGLHTCVATALKCECRGGPHGGYTCEGCR